MDLGIRYLYTDILYHGYKIEFVDFAPHYIEVYLDKDGKKLIDTIYKC